MFPVTNFTHAAQVAGLSGLLSDPTLQQTLFIPTDTAFTTFATELGVPMSEVLANTALATQIVENAIVPGLAVNQGALFSGQQLPTLIGQNISIQVPAAFQTASHRHVFPFAACLFYRRCFSA